ncbi:coiled-coil domain-containing protein 124 [Ischnura elegans]|uniref:coiled-coil domain-containing protein 124 n=1 Tax=Ischnura elegans TaxID=197161 RepID=UPI001ED872A0|nr:coiled-coil domain-containing protein 124 [Ischnura elegans]
MPKKFVGENSKSAAARARKNAAKEQEQAEKQKKLDDEFWKDDDKHIARKQQRKEEKEKKKQEILEKKAEAKQLLTEELSQIQVGGKQPLSKITRAEIQSEKEKREKAAAAAKKEPLTHLEKPLEENINLVKVEGEEARTVDEALSILSVKDPEIDRHPERRMKAAYAAFEEANLPRLKAEYSNMRLSQIKQMLRKEWMKSPDNPMNQLHLRPS